MKHLEDLLLLGDPRLYEKSSLILKSELPKVKAWVADLHNVMEEIREKYNFGRGIAAPQLGIKKRLIYINIDRPMIIINPKFTNLSTETFEMWDDCMSFPNLLVRLSRHKKVEMTWLDENWTEQTMTTDGDMAELLQHEYDHLEGILSTMRALDDQSYKWRI